MRKLEPLRTELKSFNAWITAIRRDQTRERSQAQIVEQDQRFGLVKINPLAAWSISQVWEHILNYQVPYNPLHDQSYPSIGCQPCTSPVLPGEDQRSGRWRGHDKRECGLHVGRQRLQ
jgi:phosphoadenosine phosphosulfate reductase